MASEQLAAVRSPSCCRADGVFGRRAGRQGKRPGDGKNTPQRPPHTHPSAAPPTSAQRGRAHTQKRGAARLQRARQRLQAVHRQLVQAGLGKALRVLLQVGLGRLRARADGGGRELVVVAGGAGVEEVRPRGVHARDQHAHAVGPLPGALRARLRTVRQLPHQPRHRHRRVVHKAVSLSLGVWGAEGVRHGSGRRGAKRASADHPILSFARATARGRGSMRARTGGSRTRCACSGTARGRRPSAPRSRCPCDRPPALFGVWRARWWRVSGFGRWRSGRRGGGNRGSLRQRGEGQRCARAPCARACAPAARLEGLALVGGQLGLGALQGGQHHVRVALLGAGFRGGEVGREAPSGPTAAARS